MFVQFDLILVLVFTCVYWMRILKPHLGLKPRCIPNSRNTALLDQQGSPSLFLPRYCVLEGDCIHWSRDATTPPPGRHGNCVKNDLLLRRCSRLAWCPCGGKRRWHVFHREGLGAGAHLLHRGPPNRISSYSCCCCSRHLWWLHTIISHCRPALSTSSDASV